MQIFNAFRKEVNDNMRKNIIKMVVFCSGLLLIFFGLGFTVQPTAKDYDTGVGDIMLRSVMYEKENTLDAVFFGDSVVYASIIPLQIWQQHGITSYISAAPGQALGSIVNQFENLLKKQKPKVVFYEASNLFVSTNRVDYIINQIQDRLPFFRYHNRWKRTGKKTAYDLDTILNGKGYHFSQEIKPAKIDEYKKQTTKIAKTSGENINLFSQMMNIAQKHNVKVVLYTTPSTKNWSYAKHNRITQLANQYNLTYLDLNLIDEVVIDWQRDTYDYGDHLNYFGASAVTKYLGKYLKNTDLFTDKRSLPEYSHWNKAIESVFYMKNPPIR